MILRNRPDKFTSYNGLVLIVLYFKVCTNLLFNFPLSFSGHILQSHNKSTQPSNYATYVILCCTYLTYGTLTIVYYYKIFMTQKPEKFCNYYGLENRQNANIKKTVKNKQEQTRMNISILKAGSHRPKGSERRPYF